MIESKYVPVVKGQGTFVAEWQKKNGTFKGFKGLFATLVQLWKSNAGNIMVQIKSASDDVQLFNLPAGVFIQYAEENPDSKLVLFNKEKTEWTINPEVSFNWDPIEGLSE